MMQLWVNLPARYKRTPARYQLITHEQIVNVAMPGGAEGLLIAGKYEGKTGPAQTFSPMLLMNIRVKAE